MNKAFLDYKLKVRLPVTIFVILASIAITYYVARPERDGIGYAPDQPINFSHKLHAGDMGIDCMYCHLSVEKSRHATVPPTSTCVNCHTVAKRNSEEIIKLFEYYESGKPIPWVRVHRVPDYAYFNHSAHVNKGIECKHCHGNVEQMEKLTQVQSFTMGACLSCHRDPVARSEELKGKVTEGPEHCNTCHR